MRTLFVGTLWVLTTPMPRELVVVASLVAIVLGGRLGTAIF